jgi:hypothetical protein
MAETSFNNVPMMPPRRIDHAAEGIRIVDEYFDTEAHKTEEEKLREGLVYGMEHGILTADDASECWQYYLRTKGDVA